MSVPTRWESGGAGEFWFQLRRARRWLLLLDYDGTLAPFHRDRMKAAPYPGVMERLEALGAEPRGQVVVVSGRQVADLRLLLPLRRRLEMWGSHGREHLLPGGHYEKISLEPAEQRTVDFVTAGMEEAGWGEQLERKPAGLAIHWRDLPEAVAARISRAAGELFRQTQAPATMELMPFEAGVELRSNTRTKGQVVAEMLEQEPADAVAAYLGDDHTDEDAFAEIHRNGREGRGVGILVRPEARASQAEFHLHPPEELLRFLDRWLKASKEGMV
jgi:trehalose-phosphatase